MTTPDEVRRLMRASWEPDPCSPDSRETWRPDNPARDQCGMTAPVVQDLLDGDRILAEVDVAGAKAGRH